MEKQRLYIDMNCGFGRMDARDEFTPWTKEALVSEMRYARIHAAAACHFVSRDYAFTRGDALLLDAAKDEPRIVPVATAVPGIAWEHADGPGYYEGLIDAGVRAFKMYPRRMSFPFSPFVMERFVELCAKRGVPVMVDCNETSGDDIAAVAAAFPKLPIVLLNTSWATNRYVFPILDKFASTHVEISSNQANSLLEVCKEHFGIDRVLFGTNYPFRAPGGMKAFVEYADLSEADKDKVAHGNAARLLRLDARRFAAYPESGCALDDIARMAESGRPLEGFPVVDAHVHLVEAEHQSVSQIPIFRGSGAELVAKADRLGIGRILICPWEGLRTDGSAANEASRKAMAAFPGRVSAYAMCNPHYDEDLASAVSEDFIGLKPYPIWNRYDLLGEKYKPWFEFGDRNRLVMLVHSAGEPGIAAKAEELAERYPDMSFLLAHSGASMTVARTHADIASRKPNVFLEITFTTMTYGSIEYMVGRLGADRVVFGTDAPMRDPAPQLGWLAFARIPREAKAAIFGANMLRILDRSLIRRG